MDSNDSNLSAEEQLQQATALEQEKAELRELAEKGAGAKASYYIRKSGPGFLQSAITLGGGSLASALFLGTIAGFTMMWLQPLAMLMGVIMLSAIAYVTLSTGERPFRQVNQHVSPVLGWAWLIATLMANIVWCLPQFNLGVGAIQQNLVPALDNTSGKWLASIVLLVLAMTIIWFYDSGSKGIKAFEMILKAMVALIVLCFFGVVIALTISDVGLPWSEIWGGLIPDFSLLEAPAAKFEPVLAEMDSGKYREFWSNRITRMQTDVMISAFATAVGINMTFLLPYSMLKKRWGKEHRGLARFDLSTSLLIPFVLATGCVVIAAATQFHGKYDQALIDGTASNKDYDAALLARYNVDEPTMTATEFKEMSKEEKKDFITGFSEPDRKLAAMLVKRGAGQMAASLEPIAGKTVAHFIFGLGVVGMALSTIIILMLISGFTICEMLNVPATGMAHRLGCYVAGIGVLGPFVWAEKGFYLAVPTSVFGATLLPIAYLTFFLLMNSKKVLGENRPKGNARIGWNVLMGVALAIAYFAAIWGLNNRSEMLFGTLPVKWIGIGAIILLSVAGITSFLSKEKRPSP